MLNILLISDTHSYLDPKLIKHIEEADEVWHAGDIGSIDVTEEIKKIKTLKAVHGNIDDQVVRNEFPKNLIFMCEDVKIFITHICGQPTNYTKEVKELILEEKPQVFICGHSHILLVKMDPKFNMLWMNPGACGIKGFHQVKTLLRFQINGDKIQNLEAIEIGKRI